MISSVERGNWVDPLAGKALFSDVALSWEAGRVANRLSTRDRDHRYLKNLILPYLGSVPIVRISPSVLESWIGALIVAGKAPATIRKAWQIAAGVLRMAVRDRLIPISPAREIELPSIQRVEPPVLDFEQINELSLIVGDRYRGMVLAGGLGGLRIGEVCGLQVGDADLLRRRLFVRRTLSNVDGHLSAGPPKTQKSVRAVAMPTHLSDEIAAHIGRLSRMSPESWLFQSASAGPIDSRNWSRRVWKPAVATAGLPSSLRFHDLRHSHVAILISLGEHPRTIADRLGHQNVNTVLNVYGHLFEGADQAVADRLDDRIASYARPDVAAAIR